MAVAATRTDFPSQREAGIWVSDGRERRAEEQAARWAGLGAADPCPEAERTCPARRQEHRRAAPDHVVELLPGLQVEFWTEKTHGVTWAYNREVPSADPLAMHITLRTEIELTKWQLSTGQATTFGHLVAKATQELAGDAGPPST